MPLSIALPLLASAGLWTTAFCRGGFLSDSPDRRLAVNPAARDAEFQAALDAAMGCGNRAPASDHLRTIERALAPSWRALPKNMKGKVEWRMLRSVAHRYFMQQSSLAIRGFEPMRQANESDLGTADILSERMPSLVEKLVASRHAEEGFTLEDGVAMIAALEQVIFDSESALVSKVYAQQRKSPSQGLSHQEVTALVEAYMVHWMVGDDDRSVRALLRNQTLVERVLPHWHDIKHFANGMVRSMEFAQQRDPRPGHARAALAQSYSFEDVHEAVGGITNTFASFWETECQAIKTSLVALDKTGTGRIKLADFYGANSDGEWRFGESESYLRELGALDESSAWNGKQVILPNYLLGANNCIVTTPFYQVCCVNECESVLNEIEDAVGAPMALPSEILPLVAGLTNYDDQPPTVDQALTRQLQRIAEAHGGRVPVHGRLFAQWLHYVFPRECPFPHKAGTFTALAPSQFVGEFMASQAEVNSHAAKREDGEQEIGQIKGEPQWMSQWIEEEELHADYSVHLSAPWEGNSRLVGGVFGVVAVVLAFYIITGTTYGSCDKKNSATGASSVSFESKAHFV